METPHKKFHGSDPRYTNNLHCFGETAIIKYIKNTKIKQKIKDIRPFFLGYGEKHAGGVFRFLIKTGEVLLSLDIQWMVHHYGKEKGLSPHWILTESDDDDDDEANHRDIDQVSNNDIIDAEPENDVEIGNDFENVHDKVEYDNLAPTDIK